jgi:hypothetical protein
MYQLATFQINRRAGRTDGDRTMFFAPKQDVKDPNSNLKKPFLLLFCAIAQHKSLRNQNYNVKGL